MTKPYYRKGSTSILVILSFLMLIIFSVLSISSSAADYRLAQRNATWTKDFYELEGKVSHYRYELDLLLNNGDISNIDEIADIIRERDPDALLEFTVEGMEILRIFESTSGRRILFRAVLDYDMDSFKVKAIKEVPIEFDYKDEIQFEDVEVNE
ncbi:MAG: hypothetical protein KGZ96_11085 [Clostridia bacterium]|nr:hypothetical protein [Clostridia bacterium]